MGYYPNLDSSKPIHVLLQINIVIEEVLKKYTPSFKII